MTWRIVLFAVVVGIAATAVFSGAKQPVCEGCDVVVISLDQVRAKSLSCFGYTQNTMPNLCGLAAKSSVFTNAFATASRTLDSHFSMLTSLYPSSHGMNLPYAGALSAKIRTMPEYFRSIGYGTYFLGPVADPHLPVTRGIERGFDSVIFADDPASWTDAMKDIAAKRVNPDKPEFYFLHTYKAHEPYTPSERTFRRFYTGPASIPISYDAICDYTYAKLMELHPDRFRSGHVNPDTCEAIGEYAQTYADSFKEFDDTYTIFNEKYWSLFEGLSPLERKRYVHGLYSGALYELDQDLGKFFKFLTESGKLDHTVIVIVGDQGDEFWEHDGYSHGWSLYNEVLKVPFIVYVPNRAPQISQRLVSLIDIFPTVASIAGGPMPDGISGLNVFSGRKHVAVLAEHVTNRATAVITRTLKVIERRDQNGLRIELFHLTRDPDERRNLFETGAMHAVRLLNAFRPVRPRQPDGGLPGALPTWMNEQDRQDLIESGYF